MPILGILEGITLGFVLCLLAREDLRHRRLPDRLNLVLAVSGVSFGVARGPGELGDRLIGAIAGAFFFLLVRELYQRIRKREGLGLGDVKLAGAVGAWISWQGLPSWVLLSTLAAILGTILSHLGKTDRLPDYRIPFGLYLCLGCFTIWGFGPIGIA